MTWRSGMFARRVPYVPQMEVAECGAACLSMVLGAHGFSLPLSESREACGAGRDGVSAHAILEAATKLGCDARGVKVEAAALGALPLPAILHWNFNHFVVLERTSRRGAVLLDPALGRRRVTRQELDRGFTGIALLIAPGGSFVRSQRSARRSSFVRRSLASVSRPFAALLLAALLLEVMGALLPAANQVLVDHVVAAQRWKWFWMIVLSLGVVTATRMVLQWIREWLLLVIQYSLDTSLAARFVDHMLHLPAAYFDQRTAGDLGQRVDANTVLRDLAIQLGRACLDGLLLVVYGGLLLAYDGRLGALVLGLNVLKLLIVLGLSERTQLASAVELVARGREQGAVVEAFAAPEVIKAFASERLVQQRYAERLARRLSEALTRQRLSALAVTTGGVVQGVSQGLVLWLAGTKVIEHEMSVGVLAGFLTLQQLITPALESAASALTGFAHARGILARVADVLATSRARSGPTVPGRLMGAIEFDNVSFRYGASSPWAIRNLSLRIQPGERVAFIGRSGQGKSTLARLLLGMIEPIEGRILLDGRDLRELDRAALLAQVGAVLQEPFVLDDSVRANLALRAPDAPDEVLWRAARLACIDDVIAALPEAMETRLGPLGRRLSGGQRQRLCLARALVGDIRLLVLDESTSALDAGIEARVHENLSTLACTRVVIAHRMVTVRDADTIFVIDGGRLVDAGSYAELARRPGILTALEARSP